MLRDIYFRLYIKSNMFYLNALGLISLFCICVESGCPPGWMSHGASCYLFSHDTEEWIGALDICRVLGAQLVEIEDKDEDQFILNQARQTDKSYWIALSDIEREGTWEWMNSKTLPTYTHWERGQPDNDDDDENCVNLEDSFNMLWNDLACHTNINYICERPNEYISHFSLLNMSLL